MDAVLGESMAMPEMSGVEVIPAIKREIASSALSHALLLSSPGDSPLDIVN